MCSPMDRSAAWSRSPGSGRGAGKAAACVMTFIVSLSLVGCPAEPRSEPVVTSEARESVELAPPPMRWEGAASHRHLRLSEEEEAMLVTAIEQARETLEEARLRWAHAGSAEDDSRRWLVAVRHQPDDDPAEFLWIEPAHWSAFRVEGWLRTEPISSDAPWALGALTAFSADDLIDWVVLEEGRLREGGYTILLMESLFGRADSPHRAE